ncbi:histidine--tRNA ligase [Jiella sonneratiae]|uniref:histidine--tRNA ligase n=1 Tax=Jiella sonneratiae TaxID=2816856 RepID=UPI001FD8E9E3|nr:HisS family protein [Jiella sonneratiae]
MAGKKPKRVTARVPRGFVDRDASELRAQDAMLAKIRRVYETYGFEPVETPVFEYTDALGKFLPDSDRPNEGVFSIEDDDEQWMSLRYDLTAPLARYVAENFETLPKPYRSYRAGYVFRNEKPGPGRFRQFMQFDADIVGAPNVSADAEMAMMMADTMEGLGIPRGQYVIRVNNRKVLDGVLEAIGLGGEENAGRRLTVLRAMDKLDRIGVEGVRQLLGKGRTDESGDFTAGASLSDDEIGFVQQFVEAGSEEDRKRKIQTLIHAMGQGADVLVPLMRAWSEKAQAEAENTARAKANLDDAQITDLLYLFTLHPAGYQSVGETLPVDDNSYFEAHFPDNIYYLKILNTKTVDLYRHHFSKYPSMQEGLNELAAMARMFEEAGYGTQRILIDPSVVRGLEYYTGPVFEAELLFDVTNEKGEVVRFGSVGGGGRYDGLVSRFMSQPVPATGFSIGVSRLMTALKNLGRLETERRIGPVVVTVMDRDRMADYQAMATQLRNALNPKDESGEPLGAPVPVEVFQGNPKQFGKQLQYADRRNAPCVIIQGADEKAAGKVQVKDLALGKELSAQIEGNAEWREARAGQELVDYTPENPEAMIAAVRAILARPSGGGA